MHLENFINQISDSETLVRAAIQTEDGSSQQPIPEQVHTLETPGDRRITDSPEKRFEYIEDSKVTTWYQYEIPAENLSGQNGKGKLLLESENNKLKTNPIPPKLVTGHEDSSVGGELQPAGVRRVAGLSDEKEQILDFLDNIPQEWGLTPETGLLLSGPPGTGKTQLVSEICEEIYGSIPVIISGPEILSRWVGESERILREKFEEARSRKGGVLYIDEIDSIARSRDGGGQDHTAQLVAQLLVLLDGVGDFDTADGETIQVIASTNMPHVLDPALTRPGRFGETVEFSKTDTETARAVLHHYLEEIRNSAGEQQLSDPLLEFVRTGKWTLSELDSALQNRTGADIEALVRQGVKSAAKDGQDELSVGYLKEASNELQGQTRIDYWSK